jgi:hypothetical protein
MFSHLIFFRDSHPNQLNPGRKFKLKKQEFLPQVIIHRFIAQFGYQNRKISAGGAVSSRFLIGSPKNWTIWEFAEFASLFSFHLFEVSWSNFARLSVCFVSLEGPAYPPRYIFSLIG